MGNKLSLESMRNWLEELPLEELLGQDKTSPEMVELNRLVKAARLEERFTRREDEAMEKEELEKLVRAVELEEEFTREDEKPEEYVPPKRRPMSEEAAELQRLVTGYYLEKRFTEAEKQGKLAASRISHSLHAGKNDRVEPEDEDHHIVSYVRDMLRKDQEDKDLHADDEETLAELNRLTRAYFIQQNLCKMENRQKEWVELKRLVSAAMIEDKLADEKTSRADKLSPEQLVAMVDKYFGFETPQEIEDSKSWAELQRLARAYWIEQSLQWKENMRELERLASAVKIEDQIEEQQPVLSEDRSLEADELRRLVTAYFAEKHPNDADEMAESELERLARVYLIALNDQKREKGSQASDDSHRQRAPESAHSQSIAA
mmetsp:Transcript_2168/g.6459  ORF Transcript_2168/g.6459 Transcript_2168/m.6459 type:complete len:375 (+) Transcript_2168:129-1253(+)|eukprot:CAMPEP_0198733262 /NCGR_PEP_ID=MMETSP1475-20131203/44179_1 /TAXON_ID= ORGANISM="Unidentified sp., Strain CCMP1999" /NCGR_SAMPLE_ID=MMETSP1475 /ASSEMBLY_ACC=CAM_ASM_001111 /LENGTH=374 /DNA_ID=CAMNT_0044496535 /DNA_START=103 /DNA_END=1227 /DNA_ORIENTATION=+